MLEFTAIDFETANPYRGSPCSVGLVRVRNGQIVAEKSWLIRPPAAVDWFAPWNVAIHGITPEMVAGAPRWRDVLPAILEFVGDDVLVTHNAGFDIGVIRYACAADNIEWPELKFLCSLVMSRKALALPTYRLPYVAEALGFGELVNHHDALADARAVVQVVAGLAAKYDVSSLSELTTTVGMYVGHMASGLYRGSVAVSGSMALKRSDVNPNADESGYLFGRTIVFTGTLMSMTRQVAWDECSRIGAIPEKPVTKRTNVLVVGDINPAVLRPGSRLTGKAERAFQLQDDGQSIEVMTEDDFVRCVQGEPLTGLEQLSGEPVSSRPAPRGLKGVPFSERPQPKPVKPPRPLRRAPVPTEQQCSVPECPSVAAFRTRTKPTWCETHIIDLQRRAGLQPLESFTRPDDWQLAECLTCYTAAHYRFVYILEKLEHSEATCRACFWRSWAVESRALQGRWADLEPVPQHVAAEQASENGFEYLQPLTAPSYRDDPHLTRCRRCTKVGVQRLGDMGFGCTCGPK